MLGAVVCLSWFLASFSVVNSLPTGSFGFQRRFGGDRLTQNDTAHFPLVFPREAAAAEFKPAVDASGKPRCATSGDFCEETVDYPTGRIMNLIKDVNLDFRDTGITSRDSYNPNEVTDERVCSPVNKVILPKVAKSSDNGWLYVVNDIEHTQAVKIEICRKENSPCRYIEGGLPVGYKSHCRQKYATKKLVAIHPSEKKPFADSFHFPSCCVCYVQTPPLASRAAPGGVTHRRNRNP